MGVAKAPMQKRDDLSGLRKILRKFMSQKFGTSATVTLGDLILTGLTANRLISTDASKQLTSVDDLTNWIAGTANRVTVADDGDGTVTLSAPQDIHTGASPTFVTETLTGLTANRMVGTNGSKVLESIAALSGYIAGTVNQIIITDDGDGTITISTPQDIHTGAEPTFLGLNLTAQALPASVVLGEIVHNSANNRLHFGRNV
jgi:hypothetical protein